MIKLFDALSPCKFFGAFFRCLNIRLVVGDLVSFSVQSCLYLLLYFVEYFQLNELSEGTQLFLTVKCDKIVAESTHFGISVKH